jgi:hypothetical protein
VAFVNFVTSLFAKITLCMITTIRSAHKSVPMIGLIRGFRKQTEHPCYAAGIPDGINGRFGWGWFV